MPSNQEKGVFRRAGFMDRDVDFSIAFAVFFVAAVLILGLALKYAWVPSSIEWMTP